MTLRISYQCEEILTERKYTLHNFATMQDLQYIGTHYDYDVYIAIVGPLRGYMYCVYGNKAHENYSGIATCLLRTNTHLDKVNSYVAAGYAALLHNPQYIPLVLQ